MYPSAPAARVDLWIWFPGAGAGAAVAVGDVARLNLVAAAVVGTGIRVVAAVHSAADAHDAVLIGDPEVA